MGVRFHGECARCRRASCLDKLGGECARCGLIGWAENRIREDSEHIREAERKIRRDLRIAIGAFLALAWIGATVAAYILGLK